MENIDDDWECDLLITRSGYYDRKSHDNTELDKTPGKNVTRKENTNCYILCYEHKTIVMDCENCFLSTVEKSLPNGRLPSTKQVLSYLFHRFDKNFGQQQMNIIRYAIIGVILHWISCNVYTISICRGAPPTKYE